MELYLEENANIQQAFLSTWTKNPNNKPRSSDVAAVFRVENDILKKNFEQYCVSLGSYANVGWYYHGTVLRCDIVANQRCCTNSSCSVCGVCREGFSTSKVHSHVSYQRFGHAFYLAPNSSKCHEYSEGYNGYRALLYCQVAVGRAYEPPTDDPSLRQPPLGYDSIYGRKGVHHGGIGSLNYDEVAIYIYMRKNTLCIIY